MLYFPCTYRYRAAGPDNNFFLIPALLIGWWFTSFFLRPFKKFSFYTVMLQRVIVGDMLRSAFLLSFRLSLVPVLFYFFFFAQLELCCTTEGASGRHN